MKMNGNVWHESFHSANGHDHRHHLLSLHHTTPSPKTWKARQQKNSLSLSSPANGTSAQTQPLQNPVVNPLPTPPLHWIRNSQRSHHRPQNIPEWSMVVAMMMQQTSSAPASQPIPLPSSTSSLRSPSAAPLQSQLPSPLSLGPAAPQPPPPSSHRQLPPSAIAVDHVVPIAAAHPSGEPALTMAVPLARVRLCDIVSYDGAPAGPYVRAVEALSGSLMRHNAAVIEVGSEDAALMRCGLESARLYFKARALSVGTGGGNWGKGSRGVYMYRAGRYCMCFSIFFFVVLFGCGEFLDSTPRKGGMIPSMLPDYNLIIANSLVPRLYNASISG